YISNIATLRRFLESYKNNTGLNYISGLLYLIADDFENDDGRDRFIEALNNIKNFKLGERIDILENTLKLGKILDEKNKQILSKLLIEENKGHHKKIYMELEDEYSLKYLLGISLNRIQEARREIN
ncbi:MAG: hypothetical protein H0S78_13150, partial [Tissierellales bacterium]|nr:hypothetical protein [Tissierellales bacterium]